MLSENDRRNLISTIDHAEHDRQHLSEELSDKLIAELEKCLVDWDYLTEYLKTLEAVLGTTKRPIRYDGFWTNDDLMGAVAEGGLSVLDDASLTALALDQIVLEELHHFVRDAVFTDHWVGVAERC